MHAKRSHTHIHRVRRAAACRAESLTDRPRMCACATPRRPVWSCTFPSHSDPTRMQKDQHRSITVRPSESGLKRHREQLQRRPVVMHHSTTAELAESAGRFADARAVPGSAGF